MTLMMLERIQQWIKAGGLMPVCQTLGMSVTSVESGLARCRLEADARHFNPFGTVHGGILGDLADLAMGMAFMSTLEPSQALATIELKINFVRPARVGPLMAEARVVHRGRTTGLIECSILNAEAKLVARASSTCMVVEDERAQVWQTQVATKESPE